MVAAAAAARALAGQARAAAAAAPRPRVALLQAARPPPPGAARPNHLPAPTLQAPSGAPPPAAASRSALAAAILGPRAPPPPPLGGGSPRAAALLGPHLLLGPRLPLAALGLVRFSTTGNGVRPELDDNKANRKDEVPAGEDVLQPPAASEMEMPATGGDAAATRSTESSPNLSSDAKETGVHGDKSTLAADEVPAIKNENGGDGDKVPGSGVPKTTAQVISSSNAEGGGGVSTVLSNLAGKGEVPATKAAGLGTSASTRATKSATNLSSYDGVADHHCPKPKRVYDDKADEVPGIKDEHAGGGNNDHGNSGPKTRKDAAYSTNAQGDDAGDIISNSSSNLAGKDEATATRADGGEPAGSKDAASTRATKSAPKLHSDAVGHHHTKEKGDDDKDTLAADEVPGIKNGHAGCGNTNRVDDKVPGKSFPKIPADAVFSSDVEVEGAANILSNFAGGIPGKDEVPAAKAAGEEPEGSGVPAAKAVASTCATESATKLHSDALDRHHAKPEGVDDDKAPLITDKVPDNNGAGEDWKCRCDCPARFEAFQAHSDGNREATVNKLKEMLDEHREEQLKDHEATVNKVKAMLDEHREEQLKDRERDKSSRTTRTIIYSLITLFELGLVAMLAVLYGVGYVVEKVHDKMVALSKDKKTEEIVRNIMDFVYGYIRDVNRRTVGAITRGIKNGAATVVYGIAAIFMNVGNGAAAVVHGIAAMISNGASVAWNMVAIWRWWGHKKEKKEDRR